MKFLKKDLEFEGHHGRLYEWSEVDFPNAWAGIRTG